ncbi:MAG: hypothetical protein K6E62_12580 [Lachnospiraceae bacterium]|nr:hypothetical protein [Lachnospiraceae bacterium]
MGKIQCVYDKDNNFFFHLMSVAKVGYDNAYGEKYRYSMAPEDTATLKKYEKELTMKGGEYNGKLFWTGMYAGSAEEAIRKIRSAGGFPGFESDTGALLEIFGIFLKYHDDYCEKIWPSEELRLAKAAQEWQSKFDEERLEEKAEKLVGIDSERIFFASLIGSIEHGVEAILYETEDGNIYDLFSADRDYNSARVMFLHEYIITLLEKRIPFSIEAYNRFEGLAEYYTEELIGKTYNFTYQDKYIEFYRLKMSEKSYTSEELFELARDLETT